MWNRMKLAQVTLMLTWYWFKVLNTNVPMICKSYVPYPRSTSLKVQNWFLQLDRFHYIRLNVSWHYINQNCITLIWNTVGALAEQDMLTFPQHIVSLSVFVGVHFPSAVDFLCDVLFPLSLVFMYNLFLFGPLHCVCFMFNFTFVQFFIFFIFTNLNHQYVLTLGDVNDVRYSS